MTDVFAAVIINRKAQAVDRVFHYRIPPELRGRVGVGSVVQVPFQQQRLEGVVVELTETADVPEDKIKSLLGLVGDRPLFSPELIALGNWLARYYLCPPNRCFSGYAPGGPYLDWQITKVGCKTTVPFTAGGRRLFPRREAATGGGLFW